MLLVLDYNDERKLAIHHTKLIQSDWTPIEACSVSLTGLNLDTVWENLITQVGSIEVEQGHSLDEQIASDEQKAKIEREIARLERMARNEKQPKKKSSDVWSFSAPINNQKNKKSNSVWDRI